VWFRHWRVWVSVVAVCVAAVVLLDHAKTNPATAPSAAVLHVANQKDGDSFVASDGTEYRLGMVNAPELDEPCGRDAREFSRQFLALGLSVDAYSSDRYGRRVAEVFDRSGKSLNVALARSGYADDRYLDSFRDENRDLARRLEAAFARAKKPTCVEG
jgi:endonuclease YncB( thermonuclease family)